MSPPDKSDITGILKRASEGDDSAVGQLMPLVYDELRRLAGDYLRRERSGHTLQATALVHEAYLRLVEQKRVRWQNRAHFFALAAQAIRRILVDHARAHGRAKRGAGLDRVELDEEAAGASRSNAELIDLHEAMEALAKLSPRQAKIVEMRFFAGLGLREIAEVLDLSPRTVAGDWSMARAWLHRELRGGSGS